MCDDLALSGRFVTLHGHTGVAEMSAIGAQQGAKQNETNACGNLLPQKEHKSHHLRAYLLLSSIYNIYIIEALKLVRLLKLAIYIHL